MALRAVRALWEDQYRAEAQTSFRRTVGADAHAARDRRRSVRLLWLASRPGARTDRPPALEVKATCQDGVWSFAAQGGVRGAMDLRLRGARCGARLQAGAHPTEFFVPGSG